MTRRIREGVCGLVVVLTSVSCGGSGSGGSGKQSLSSPPRQGTTSSSSSDASTTGPGGAAGAGPADVCDLLSKAEAEVFIGGPVNQLDHGAHECVYDSLDSSHRVYIQRMPNGALPSGIPDISGLGYPARGDDTEVDVVISSTLFKIGTFPTPASGRVLSLAMTIVPRVTGS